VEGRPTTHDFKSSKKHFENIMKGWNSEPETMTEEVEQKPESRPASLKKPVTPIRSAIKVR
jgi:hypothetical protein